MPEPTSERWTRLKALFNGALDQPPASRERWLRDACQGDVVLLHEAQALLDAHDGAGEFLEHPPAIDLTDIILTADTPVLAPGTFIGSYRIVEEIGRGGMGIVYLAEDQRLGRRVALKALPPAVASDPSLRERLRREARAAATISHPAVATVYALEEIGDQLVIASEYVRGRTLRSELQHGALPESTATRIAAQIARALAAAHAAGIVHRDLKPENVLLTADGGVKVVDFGIAHVDNAGVTRLTMEGAIVGTPAYMAPEQLIGGEVDARADIYAAGVIVAEMIKGQDSVLAAIAERCMQPSREARYASAAELVRALEGRAAPSRWWWEFHQAVAALLYWLMVIPAWHARGLIGGGLGRAFFITVLAAVIVAAALRLHLWFTARFYPPELSWVRRRVGVWIHVADWIFALTLVAGGTLIGVDSSPTAILLISFGIGAGVAFLLIEPATARAAFRSSSE